METNPMNALYTSLSKAQSQLHPAEKDSVAGAGSFKYKYANLSAVMEVAQEALANNGLCFTTRVVTEDHYTIFYARLAHVSGEYLESRIEIGIDLRDIKSIQELGKVITYLRRYTLSMMVGIVTEEDDDAQGIVQGPRSTPASRQAAIPQRVEYISDDQMEALERELKEHLDVAKAIIEKYGSLNKMPKSQFFSAMDRIREIKRLKEQPKG